MERGDGDGEKAKRGGCGAEDVAQKKRGTLAVMRDLRRGV